MKIYSYTLIALLSIFCLPHIAQGQDMLGNSLYTFNPMALNPAYAGKYDNLVATLQARSQDMIGNGSYKGSLLTAHGLLNKKIGIGGIVATGTQGSFQTFNIGLNTSYKVTLSAVSSLTFGVSTSMQNSIVQLNSTDYNQFVNFNDPTISSEQQRQSTAQIGAGVLFVHKHLEISLSAPSLLDDSGLLQTRFKGYAGVLIESATSSLSIKPSMLLQVFEASSAQFDFNTMLLWKEKVWLQPGFRSNGNLLLGAGVQFNDLSLGYSFNLPTGNYTDIGSNAHEILLRLAIGKAGEGEHPRGPW